MYTDNRPSCVEAMGVLPWHHRWSKSQSLRRRKSSQMRIADTNEIKLWISLASIFTLSYFLRLRCIHVAIRGNRRKGSGFWRRLRYKSNLKCWILQKNRRLREYCTFFTDGFRHPILNYPKRLNICNCIKVNIFLLISVMTESGRRTTAAT